ncbi:hypothetical protein CXG81DRAFT_24072 [Caulochytrium protostelioides]|uniref:CN hydrolase domain-containing protein n=1 Tax=Caulochytrium protostelioides TaxID=1555241 RepID=A0A4P9XCW7_9FUNG|nr:hypothetical protein CXG81DRAFT_24072 [Caulochytrium protostelioides]|eukprot:RKP03298.1 hypothetical protein CXG81DRAFT_24072 [Caulochytrium protostelioides]
MQIAILQIAPVLRDVAGNIAQADDLLARRWADRDARAADDGRDGPRGPDLITLPELAFTGYNFVDRADILPYCELIPSPGTSLLGPRADAPSADDAGPWPTPTLDWACATASRYGAFVQVGLPERALPAPMTPLHNAVVLVAPDGRVVHVYRKHFMYDTDKTWATPGPAFEATAWPAGLALPQRLPRAATGAPPVATYFGFGICMDLAPFDFTAPYEAYELARFHQAAGTALLSMNMAWLASDPEDGRPSDALEAGLANAYHDPPLSRGMLRLLEHWVSRLTPLLEDPANTRGVLVVIANRTGTEPSTPDDPTRPCSPALVGRPWKPTTTFAGQSCILRIAYRQCTVVRWLDNAPGMLVHDL